MDEVYTQAIAAVAYELARHNGESPLDRGAALGRRIEALACVWGLVGAFEAFKRERGYRREESGEELYARVEALVDAAAASPALLAA